MNQGLLTGEKTAAVQKLLEALQQKKTAAVYDLPESQATYLAALITRITGKRVLLVLPNDLAANKARQSCSVSLWMLCFDAWLLRINSSKRCCALLRGIVSCRIS